MRIGAASLGQSPTLPDFRAPEYDLVTAAPAAMDEAVRRFAPYAECGRAHLWRRQCAVWRARLVRPQRVATRNKFPYQAFGGFDYAITTFTSASAAAAAAGAGTEIMSTPYRHVDPNILGGGLVG